VLTWESTDLAKRTKEFAYCIIRLNRNLPHTYEAEIIGKQLLRAATSVAANYRAAKRAHSRPEFISKLGIVVEEMDESLFWLECISEKSIIPPTRMREIIKETNELVAIFTAGRRNAKTARS
jgi:four helix bundle protein